MPGVILDESGTALLTEDGADLQTEDWAPGLEFSDEFSIEFSTTQVGFSGIIQSTLPKLGGLASAVYAPPPARTGASAGSLPKFTTVVSAIATLPGRDSFSTATLPKFTGLAAGTQTRPARSGTASGTTPRFDTFSAGLFLGIGRGGVSSGTLPKFGSLASGTRTIVAAAAASASRLPRFGTLSFGSRAITGITGTSASGMPRLRSEINAILLPPPGSVFPVTAGHLIAPPWRQTDAGTGQRDLTFPSPLDPASVTFFTIDFRQELDGSDDAILQQRDGVEAVLAPAAIAAGVALTRITFNPKTITIWLGVNEETSANWDGAGETHIILFSAKTGKGQVFRRKVALTIKRT